MSLLHVQICKIDSITPIDGADRIVLAQVKGWNCIIGKDTFKVGEACIFVPPDAVLPDELIKEQNLTYLKGTNRIRTIKLKGVISQGLILPISILSPAVKWHEGEDVAKVLNIKKYEPPVNTPGVYTPNRALGQIKDLWEGVRIKKVPVRRATVKTFHIIVDQFKPKKKLNPYFDIYTDLDNVKHYPEVFAEGEEVVITEKIHGTNFRAGTLPLNETVVGRIKQFFTKQTHEFCYGSHRVQKSAFSGKGFYGEDVYGQIAERYNLKDIIPPDYIIYGEIYGQKIQELTYGIQGIDVVFFDLKYKGNYVDYEVLEQFCIERKLPMAPVLWKGKFDKGTLKYLTEGDSVLATLNHLKNWKMTGSKETVEKGIYSQIREGCVVKSLNEEYSNRCGRKILKSISAEYLLTKKQENPEEVIDENVEYPH